MIFDIIAGTSVDDSSVADPYFSSVVLGMHMDGTNGGITFPDITGKTTTPTNVTTSTASLKFGTASAYFNGGGKIVISDVGVFSFTGDYTVEFWASGDIYNYCTFSNTARTYLYNNQMFINDVAIAQNLNLDTTPAWKHIAIVRSGTTLTVYQNGGSRGFGTSGTTHNYTNMTLGLYVPNANLHFTGYMDDLRITKGVARYTANFTPPTRAFPNF